MERLFYFLGSLMAGLAVVAGAFGAHGLTKVISTEQLEIYEKAVRYQMYHALALSRWSRGIGLLTAAGWLFCAGIVLFSGSLYILALSRFRWFGAITPLGGMAFAAGWLILSLGVWRG